MSSFLEPFNSSSARAPGARSVQKASGKIREVMGKKQGRRSRSLGGDDGPWNAAYNRGAERGREVLP